jgi:hypothetical protein
MKQTLVLVGILAAGMAWAEPVVLVSTLPDRPVFNYEIDGVVQTRALAPGNRISLDPGLFSGLGLKKIPLTGGTYYLAKIGGKESLYRLPPDQALILNASGLAVAVGLDGVQSVSGLLATGTLALGGVGPSGLRVEWDDGTGGKTQVVDGGQVYRLLLDSPEGVGTTVSLIPWD